MSDGTAIEWTDATLNVVNGCSVVSPGCTNCYAMRSGGRNLPNHPATGLTKATKAGHVWTGEVRFNDKALLQPLRWKRARKIFWNAHGDLFHEKVPDEWIDRCFAVMALTPHHIHQVLTKRPERMREYLADHASNDEERNLGTRWCRQVCALGYKERALQGPPCFPLPNVWLGVSVEDQQRADRIVDLLATPAAKRWVSAEPLLGPLDLRNISTMRYRGAECLDALTGRLEGMFGDYCSTRLPKLDWLVVGGESGTGARPMHPDWARSLRDQCAAAGVPFLFKQWGEFAPGEIAGEFLDSEKAAKGVSLFDGRWDECWSEPDGHCDDEPDLYRVGKHRAGRLLDGVPHDGYPA